MKILALFILIVSVYYCFKKQYILVFIYSFFASTSDSAALKYIMDNSFSGFSYCMQFLVFCASLICVLQLKGPKSLPKNIPFYIKSYLFLLIFTFILFFIQEMDNNSILKTIALYINYIVDYSLASFVILLCFIKRINLKKYLYVLLLSHCILAFLTIYGPYLHLSQFELLNFDLYYEGAERYLQRSTLTPFLIRGEFLTILQDKWQIHIGSCFGNSNILGVYAGALVILSVIDLLGRKYIAIVPLLLGFILWMDAGTRAPLFTLIIFLLYYFYRRNSIVFISLITILILFFIDAAVGLFSQSIERSVIAREDRISYEWDFFMKHFFIGANSNDSLPASPHQLWLLYGARLGIVGLLFSFVYFYIYPMINYVRARNNEHKERAFCMLVLLIIIGNTNNFTALVLYNTIFCYYVFLTIGTKEQSPMCKLIPEK